ncbi:autotransporter outer membrane beta-barrel domain-containing protein [Shigella flexneri]
MTMANFNNDVAGTRGVYQAGIRSSFTPTLSGHLSVSYGNGAGVESPWNTQAGVVLDVLITKNKQAVMCHGLFIELIADIKKPTVKA